MSERRGLDREIAEKLESKYTADDERKALEWITQVTGIQVNDLWEDLKNGAVLCALLNEIWPGVVPNYVKNPTHVLEERANLQAYLSGCAKLGVPSSDLFTLSDIANNDKASLAQVLQNIYALGRQAQVIPGFKGPKLGVTYRVSLEEQKRRKEKKEREAREQMERLREQEEEMTQRRRLKERLKRSKTEKRIKEEEERAEKRRARRGLHRVDTFGTIHRRKVLEDDNITVKYGMDGEIEEQLEDNYDYYLEAKVMDWIEAVTGEPVDYFYESLRNGVILCKLINKIRPGMITKINTQNIALQEQENIKRYLRACEALGVRKTDLFTVSDLYERKSLSAVLNNITALARIANNSLTFEGPKFDVSADFDKILTYSGPEQEPAPENLNRYEMMLTLLDREEEPQEIASAPTTPRIERVSSSHSVSSVPASPRVSSNTNPEEEEYDEAYWSEKLKLLQKGARHKKGNASRYGETKDAPPSLESLFANAPNSEEHRARLAALEEKKRAIEERRKEIEKLRMQLKQLEEKHSNPNSPREVPKYASSASLLSASEERIQRQSKELEAQQAAKEEWQRNNTQTEQKTQEEVDQEIKNQAKSDFRARIERAKRLAEEKRLREEAEMRRLEEEEAATNSRTQEQKDNDSGQQQQQQPQQQPPQQQQQQQPDYRKSTQEEQAQKQAEEERIKQLEAEAMTRARIEREKRLNEEKLAREAAEARRLEEKRLAELELEQQQREKAEIRAKIERAKRLAREKSERENAEASANNETVTPISAAPTSEEQPVQIPLDIPIGEDKPQPSIRSSESSIVHVESEGSSTIAAYQDETKPLLEPNGVSKRRVCPFCTIL